jgi:orotate phosphoribosyltransferase-like protein
MAFDFVVQRLQIGDVILLGETEATVTRDIQRTETSVRVTLRLDGSSEDVVKEWPVEAMVTVVRGP